MSLKEAVGALRSLKAELEASRRSKVELEVAHRGLIEELRIARQGQKQRAPNGEAAASPEDGKTSGGTHNTINSCDASAAATFEEVEARERSLEEKLLEAKHALEERDALNEEARRIREELASVKVGAEASTASIQRELQEALAERDQAMGENEGALRQLEAAKIEATKQGERAMVAEEELAGAAENAALLRARLDETCQELESAQNALEITRAQKPSSNGDGRGEGEQVADGDDAAVAELESELRSVREAVAVLSPEIREPPRAGSARAESSQDAAKSAAQRAEHLQAELDSAVRENLEMRESLELSLQKQKILGEAIEENGRAAASHAAAASELTTEKEGEIESLRGRLAVAEEKMDGAEQTAASEEATRKEKAHLREESLEEAKDEITGLKASLSEAVSAREGIERMAAVDAATKGEELSSLQGAVDTLRAEILGAAETARAATTIAQAEAEATAGEAAAKIVELETALREAEADMAFLREVAASTVETRQVESKAEAAAASAAEAAAAADVAAVLKAKEAAQDEAKQSASRASAAEASVLRLKSKAGELKAGRVEADKAAKLVEEERNEAVAAVAEANAGRVDVEETLLMANNELQRLRRKWEEAVSEVEKLRAESERLKATVETLRSSVAAVATRDNSESTENRAAQTDKEAEVDAGTEVREEISRLQNTIEELEEALKDKSGSGGDGGGGGGGRGEGRGADHNKDTSGGQDGAGDLDGDMAETTKEVIEERDRLRTDLRQAHKEAATRATGLEMQLADKEREAADTQRRLYHRQTQLESELEELSVNHDALRVEMARMDASMQDAADASSSSSPSNSRGGVGAGGAGAARNRRDAAAIGAEVGGAVGGILRGNFWSGWGGSGGGLSSATVGVNEGEGRRVNEGSAAAAEATALGRRTQAKRGGGGDRVGREAAVEASTVEDENRQSISRMHDTMMARLQEAANKPISREEEEKESKSSAADIEQAGEATPGRDITGGVGEKETDPESPGHGGTGVKEEWVEEAVEHPAPDYGVDSPVIRYLLQQWSSDPEKLKYLSLWLRCVIERRKVPDAFPSGLQLVGLAPEIKDGFLTLVIPMIRLTGGLPVLVHSRLSPPEERASVSGTPDAGTRGPLWDLRVKVDLQGGVKTTRGEKDGTRGAGKGGKGGGRGGAGRARAGRVEGQLSRVQEDGAVPRGRKKGPR